MAKKKRKRATGRKSTRRRATGRKSTRKTYKKKTTARRAKPKGCSIYEVKGGWRISKRKKRRRR